MRQGVTAEFNLNVLRVLNRELGADFDLGTFEHRAFYDRTLHRIEMHLVSTDDQIVHIPGVGVSLVRRRRVDPHGDQLQVRPRVARPRCSARAGMRDRPLDHRCRADVRARRRVARATT